MGIENPTKVLRATELSANRQGVQTLDLATTAKAVPFLPRTS